jgi:TonB-dependent starch-binding outer membrane protein SusC
METLVFSYIGYQLNEVEIQGSEHLEVSLTATTVFGEELVVVGYGVQRAQSLTGSISHISSEQVSANRAANLGQALQGAVAGAQVVQMGTGEPGGRPMIRIRGTNSINTDADPLFVVDGIAGVSNALENLNPNDIQSIDILKDASATAIYGARGANGVVIITTKRGQSDQLEVNYRGSVSMNTMQRHVHSLDADETMYVYVQAMMNGDKYGNINRNLDYRAPYAAGPTFDDFPHLFESVPQGSYIVPLEGASGNFYRPRFNTNWEDEIFNDSFSNDHHLSISGGSASARYSMSLGMTNEDGLMMDSWFKRYTGRLTGDFEVFDWLRLNSQIGFTSSERTLDGGITRSATEVWGFLPIRYPLDVDTYGHFAGRWGSNADFGVGEQWYNVVWRRNDIYGLTDRNQVTGSVSFDAQLTENLSFVTNFATDYNVRKTSDYRGQLDRGASFAQATLDQGNTLYWQNENYLNYLNTFGGVHNISGVLGASWSEIQWENMFARNSNFFTDFFGYSNLGAGAAPRPSVNSNDGKSALNSYFLRLHYDYDERYLVTLTGRIDGSSKFGENTKYGYFPSIGLAWNVFAEDFYRNSSISNFIPYLKLRVSYGITGNQEIGSYVTQQFAGASSIVFGNDLRTGIFPTTLGNPDLKWEETSQLDIGIEFSLFNERLSIITDFYHKETTDMLLNVPLPFSTSTGSVTRNFGSVENRGIEFTVNSQNVMRSNFTWRTSITASANRNRITQLGPTGAPIFIDTGAGNATSVLMEGQPIGSFWGLNRLGTWGTHEATEAARYGLKPGDLKHEDKTGDGNIDLIADGQIIGRAWPRILANIRNNFSYRNFDAYIDIAIAEGMDKGFVRESAEDRQLVSGGLNSTLTAWRPDNQDSMVAQIRPGSAGAYYLSNADTHIISDASFIRGANAMLGYTLPAATVNRLGLSGVRIFFQATNFFLITQAEGYDPEGSSLDKQRSLAPNHDKYQYPRPSTYSLGIDINF